MRSNNGPCTVFFLSRHGLSQTGGIQAPLFGCRGIVWEMGFFSNPRLSSINPLSSTKGSHFLVVGSAARKAGRRVWRGTVPCPRGAPTPWQMHYRIDAPWNTDVPHRTSLQAPTPWPNMERPRAMKPTRGRSNRARRIAREDAPWNLCRSTIGIASFVHLKCTVEIRRTQMPSLQWHTDASLIPRSLLDDTYGIGTWHAWDREDRFRAPWCFPVVPSLALQSDDFQTRRTCAIACLSTNSRLSPIHCIRSDARRRFPLPSPRHTWIPWTPHSARFAPRTPPRIGGVCTRRV